MTVPKEEKKVLDFDKPDPVIDSTLLSEPGLWAMGSAQDGQIGIELDRGRHILSPTPLVIPESEGKASLVDFAPGDGWTFLVMRPEDPSKEDFIVSSGECELGQIAQWEDKPIPKLKIAPRLETWPALPRFLSVIAGRSQTFLLDVDHKIWAVGNNHLGQLGAGFPRSIMEGPFPVELESGIKDYRTSQLVTSFSHSLLITDDGRMWVAGNNNFGQLGTGSDLFPELTFRHLPLGSNVSSVSCGHSFSIAATGS